ncbi:MAG: DnaJ domain-containing protein [Candidatus Humimicrobiaceae bacterium]
MKRKVEYKDIENARRILEIGEKESINSIKKKYRKLSLKYHPDKCKDTSKAECEEKIKEINQAYETIMDYCFKYPVSFNREMVRNLEDGEYIKYHRERFYDTWW